MMDKIDELFAGFDENTKRACLLAHAWLVIQSYD